MIIEKNIDKIDKILNDKNVVEFKIYGLRYRIEKKDNYTIYPINDNNRKKSFNSLDELFKKYEIYNENLKDNDNKIKL